MNIFLIIIGGILLLFCGFMFLATHTAIKNQNNWDEFYKDVEKKNLPVPETMGWLWPKMEDVPSGEKATVPPLLMILSIALILLGSLVKFFLGMTWATLNSQVNFLRKNS